MSKSLSILIRYDVPYSQEHVEAVGNACLTVVSTNWLYADHWSDPLPDPAEQLRRLVAAGAMDKLRFLEETENGNTLTSKWCQFPFSPLSWRDLELNFWRYGNRDLGVLAGVHQAALLTEYAGYRESVRMEWEWNRIREQRGESPLGKIGPDPGHPDYHAWFKKRDELAETPSVVETNRKCFVRILKRLLALFPVKEVDCDEELKEWMETFDPDAPTSSPA